MSGPAAAGRTSSWSSLPVLIEHAPVPSLTAWRPVGRKTRLRSGRQSGDLRVQRSTTVDREADLAMTGLVWAGSAGIFTPPIRRPGPSIQATPVRKAPLQPLPHPQPSQHVWWWLSGTGGGDRWRVCWLRSASPKVASRCWQCPCHFKVSGRKTGQKTPDQSEQTPIE